MITTEKDNASVTQRKNQRKKKETSYFQRLLYRFHGKYKITNKYLQKISKWKDKMTWERYVNAKGWHQLCSVQKSCSII